jgi:general secretion pathway protein C
MLSAKRILSSGRFPVTGIPLVRLIPWFNVLITAMLAYSLAQLTWLVLGQGAGKSVNPLPVTVVTPAQVTTPAVNLERVAALHLLGSSNAPQSPATHVPISAPETRLNLTLRGVLALNSQQEALAIIAQGAGEEESYKVGDSLPGGAVLYEIQTDRVILERAGRFETLTLPKEKMVSSTLPVRNLPVQNRPSPMRPSVAMNVAPPRVDSRRLRAMRETIKNNPQEAMQLVNAQPVMEGGKLKGYRVNPGRDRNLFNSVGLRPGDIVTSVNGIPLNDMSQMGMLFNQLSSASRLDITVERGGRQTQLSLSLE